MFQILGITFFFAVCAATVGWLVLFAVAAAEKWGGLRRPLRTIGLIAPNSEWVSAGQWILGTTAIGLVNGIFKREPYEPWMDTFAVVGKFSLIFIAIVAMFAVPIWLTELWKRRRG